VEAPLRAPPVGDLGVVHAGAVDSAVVGGVSRSVIHDERGVRLARETDD
jgi:hypothetical protein